MRDTRSSCKKHCWHDTVEVTERVCLQKKVGDYGVCSGGFDGKIIKSVNTKRQMCCQCSLDRTPREL